MQLFLSFFSFWKTATQLCFVSCFEVPRTTTTIHKTHTISPITRRDDYQDELSRKNQPCCRQALRQHTAEVNRRRTTQKMLIKTIAILLTHLATLISAVPITTSPALHHRDNPWSVYICEIANWGGLCHYITASQGECMTLSAGSAPQIRGFGPDRGQLCRLYDQANCAAEASAFEHLDLEFPGVGDLREIGWGGKMSSWRCVELGSTPVP